MSKPTIIHWFRHDLRLSDNPALTAAADLGLVLPIYIHDTVHPDTHAFGAASRVWLHHSLADLSMSLTEHLAYFMGDPLPILLELCQQHDVKTITWNRCYAPWQVTRDKQIKTALSAAGITVMSFNGSLLWEPWEIHKDNGDPYRVFTPFYRKGCLQAAAPREPLMAPAICETVPSRHGVRLAALNLLPSRDWGQQIAQHWSFGEQAAQERLETFIAEGLSHYKVGRNFPAKPYVSRLSPYLHMGQISPNQIWYMLRDEKIDSNVDHFCSELGWREFSYNLLYYNPHLPIQNIQTKFDAFPWQDNPRYLKAWQHGKTGIPMVDAGMRELRETGYMHNRVRMIVGSFLVKNLGLDWRLGERWFWDCLVDADIANNSAGWQWIAGCGADAAPYFRIFNPVTQGEKFDGEGAYVRRYVPELAQMPDKFLFQPWAAPRLVLQEAGVDLGTNYPQPLVDLKASREAALAAFASLKES